MVTVVHATGFYHFLLEELPRLLWARACFPNVRALLWEDAPSHCHGVLRGLAELGILDGFDRIKGTEMLHCSDYVFTQAEAYSGFVHSDDVTLLRAALEELTQSSGCDFTAIYISRGRATRRFANQTELEEALEDVGVKVLYTEELEFAQQVCTFKKARLIVADHGAGLANIVWCAPGAHVVELFSPGHFNDCYARLASTCGHTYHPLWADATVGWGRIEIATVIAAVTNV